LDFASHRERAARRWRDAALAVCAVIALSTPAAAQQPGWQPVPGDGPANTTIIPRTAVETKAAPATTGELALVAYLTDDGQRIDQGLVWRVFQDAGNTDAKPKLVNTSREQTPVLKLAPGDYVVNAAFGRAHLTRKVKIEAGGKAQERFVLNAGGLRVSAQLATGGPAPERTVVYEIQSGETDQLGNRTRIMGGGRPGVIVRLNAGIYHIVSTYGDANAVVRADVTVEAGKLTEAVVNHPGARVTFKLVTQAGGEAQADTQWSLINNQGETVKDSVGALPTHILAPGAYIVNAKLRGRSFKRSFRVNAGETAQIEVVMQ
jgi:hypothetical protein